MRQVIMRQKTSLLTALRKYRPRDTSELEDRMDNILRILERLQS